MKKITKASLICFYNSERQILLQERGDYSKYWEEWAFFGGWIEEWETALEAFLREAKEELGLDMNDFEYDYIWEFIHEFPERKAYRHLYLIETEFKETDFTVFEWSWAKYFTLDESRDLSFPVPPWELIDILEKYI